MKNWQIGLVLFFIVIAGAFVYFYLASLKSADTYEGTDLSGKGPDFRLMDQYGDLISLSDFKSKVVVLTFFDSQCQDVCPLTAAQLLQTYKKLDKSEASQVVFLAVNVNIQANAVTDVLFATRQWHLDEISNWHFLTGNAEVLKPIWSDYGVAVNPQSDGSILHTPGVFLIDGAGQERRYISTPYSEDENTESTLPLNELLVKHIHEIMEN